MKEELEKTLKEKYPKVLWGLMNPDAGPNRNLLCFGLMCGDGWFKIIDDLCAKLEPLCEQDEDGMWYPQAVEIKEKFGGLRFYISGGSDEDYNHIREAEDLSYKTCEHCGAPSNPDINTGHWIYTVCTQCWNQMQEDRAKHG